MAKGDGPGAYLRVVSKRGRAGHGPVVEFVMTPRGPDGSSSDLSRQLRRSAGRNRALGIAVEVLTACGVPEELVRNVEAEMDPGPEAELVVADASPEEVQAVERLAERWRQAVSQAQEQKAISGSTASTYLQHVVNFAAWVKGDFTPGRAGRRRRDGTEAAEAADSD